MYADDQRNLNEWLKTLNHVTYKEYDASYEEGAVKITCGNGDEKKFGVGRLTNLEAFEKMVFDDLLHSIQGNFVRKKEDLKEYELKNLAYEIAMKEKGSTSLVDEV